VVTVNFDYQIVLFRNLFLLWIGIFDFAQNATLFKKLMVKFESLLGLLLSDRDVGVNVYFGLRREERATEGEGIVGLMGWGVWGLG
jgi:hypothetical protein